MGRLFLLFALFACALSATEFRYKKLAGPPSEFENHRIPSPVKAAISEDSALIPVRFSGEQSVVQKLAVDSQKSWQFVVYTPESETYSLELLDPQGKTVDLEANKVPGEWPISSTGQMVSAQGYRFVEPFPRGLYSLRISKKDGSRLAVLAKQTGHPSAYVMLWNESPIEIFSHLGTYFWEEGRTVGITAQMHDAAQSAAAGLVRGQRPEVLKSATIKSAKLDVYLPDGQELEIDMKDDGSSMDLAANDGVYGATWKASESGMWRITAVFEGTLADGTPFMRSAEHAMVAVKDDLSFPTGRSASLLLSRSAVGSDQVPVSIPVSGGKDGLKVRAYAEVYGTVPKTTTLKPACWIGGFTVLKNGAIELELNKRWLATAGVEAPLVLKNVYIADSSVHVPLATADEMSVDVSTSMRGATLARHLNRTQPAAVPTEEMLKGVRPAHLHPVAAAARRRAMIAGNVTNADASLVLLHGYCAQDNPWTRNKPVTFTNYVAFGNLKQSQLNDHYAQDVIEMYGHLPSWGLVGHSQGGMVSLHLHNFYWSPNDAVSVTGAANRAVQSMGTPYLGVSGAGAALDLGVLFGLGCGENFDLTLDGANLWLSGLQAEARKDVYFYTTVYKYTFLHPRYCNLAVNFVLSWPNDGTVEYDMCQLPGANSVSNTEGECHSVNMKWPPQTENVNRNREINAAAAR